ncbi:nicotinate phosphoribosyltransferase [Azohydromonas sediminis]|uniref:nicotinate phosphoribosyltransferase n=1 Tax=Azohydromonas sediminis TaxID=2259674 RepID=UPI000E650D6B|nr:nicotinate phosphoribosyltransferase [Azohydromonas sediminis]
MTALLTDLYQLTMLQAYLDEGMQQEATFELFVRKLPAQRNFLVAAGLEQALQFLETLAFTDDEIAWVERQGGFRPALLDHLRTLRFTGDVHAMPEGTVFFADEPILRVTAPLPLAQLVESRLLNIVHFQTLIASKAARVVLAAPGRLLVDFGMRRAHGAEAALFAARAAYLAGFDGTATAEAARRYGLPAFGTMAHSFVQAHASEADAFVAFARSRPQRPTLLVDTYDPLQGVQRVIDLAPRLAAEGIEIGGIRLDSGDMAAQARAVRPRLDAAGLRGVRIFASGNLDEWRVAELLAAGAPIDGFGIGTALDTSSDAPSLDAVYKLQVYAGVARRKRSAGKATLPGVKQVVRRFDAHGRMLADRVQLEGEPLDGEPLLQPVMRGGRRVGAAPTLADARRRCTEQLRALPEPLRGLDPVADAYPVEISAGLHALATAVDAATR